MEENGLQVRALVGVQHGITTPTALSRLRGIGELRIVDDKRLFHAKVYLFHRTGGGVGWIGSANFTGKGFGSDGQRNRRNEEVMFETRAIREVSDWFEGRWEEAGPLNVRMLKKYCEEYRPPKQGVLDERLQEEPDKRERRETLVPAREFLEPISAWAKAHPNKQLPPTAYIPAILGTLEELGGVGTRQAVLKRVEKIMEPVLRSIDYRMYRKGERIWSHQCDDVRRKMANKDGLLEPTSVTGNGKWGLTPEGLKASRGSYGATWQRFVKALE